MSARRSTGLIAFTSSEQHESTPVLAVKLHAALPFLVCELTMGIPTTFEEKGTSKRVMVSPLFAVASLCVSVLFFRAAGRESSRFFLLEDTSSLCLEPLAIAWKVDHHPTASSSAWIQVDSLERGFDRSSSSQNSNENSQLLVDLQEVDANTIGSEPKLSELIINFANVLNLTVTVYQCHTDPDLRFISCLGALDNGHVSIHSSTTERTVSLDVYARGRIMDAKDIGCAERFLKYHFLNSSDEEEEGGFDGKASNLRWVLKAKGPPSSNHVLSQSSASVRSQGKGIDVQSTRYDNAAAYHETLVHPGMFAHKAPKRVAIVWRGDGATATLREVLKHNTVEKVVMIEIDQTPNTTSTAVPEWNDRSDLDGTDEKCMADPRVEIYTEDAFKWFADRYATGTRTGSREEEPPFDIIIMNAVLDDDEFAGRLLSADNTFLGSLYNALDLYGILISQVGEAPDMSSPSEEHSVNKHRFLLINTMVDLGFEGILDYSDSHCRSDVPSNFLVSFKSFESQLRWSTSEAQTNLEMQKRSIRQRDGQSPFDYFDGATMLSYQDPDKASATVFCRQDPVPAGCQAGPYGYDPESENIPVSSLKVSKSGVGENAGRGVFSLVNIPANSYIALEAMIHPIKFRASSISLVNSLGGHSLFENFWMGAVEVYMEGYGYSSTRGKVRSIDVDSCLITFVNHGCNGTFNVGDPSPFTEINASDAPDEVVVKFIEEQTRRGKEYVYNPNVVRESPNFQHQTTRKPIMKGEELLDNYLDFYLDLYDFANDINGLKLECAGGVTDESVTKYEYEHQHRPEKDSMVETLISNAAPSLDVRRS